MCFIERETQNFILKFRENFLWRETVVKTHGMKSDKSHFYVKFMQLCGTCGDWQVFVLIPEEFEEFS